LASIYIENSGKRINVSPAISILNNLLREGEPISHVCGGKAQCGTCRIEILEGMNKLSRKTEIEIRKLDALGNPPNVRLACQTYTFGDISVRILLPKHQASIQ